MKVEDSRTSNLHLLTSNLIHNRGKRSVRSDVIGRKLAMTVRYALRIFSRPSPTFLVAFLVSTTSLACLTIVS